MLKNAQRIILAIIVATLLIEPFVKIDLNKGISLLGIILYIVILPALRTKNRRLPLILVAVGLLVLLITKQPFSVILEGASSMLDIVSILLVMQLFSIPIRLGTYTRDLEFLLFKYIRKEQSLFFFTTLITHFFSTFLLFGTIPVMLSLLGEPLKNNVKNYQRFAATAMSRGYALMISWSPGAVMFLLVTGITHLEWNQVFLPGLLLSLIGMATSVFLEGKLTLAQQNMASVQGDEKGISKREAWQSVLDIIFVVSSMIIVVYSLEKSKLFASTYCVMLAGIVIVMLWLLKFRKVADFKRTLRSYWQEDLLKSLDLIITFVALGVLIKTVENANLVNYLYDLLGIPGWNYVIILLIPLVLIVTAILGLHPLISISVVGNIFMAAQTAVPAVAIALSLLLGAIISFVVAPLTGIILTLANLLNEKSTRIALQWNGLFSAVFLLEGIIFIYLWITYAVGLYFALNT